MKPTEVIARFTKQYGMDEILFREKATVLLDGKPFSVSLVYTPAEKTKDAPKSNSKKAFFQVMKHLMCYIEHGKLRLNAKQLAYMMCSGVFIWITTKEEYDSANQWFKIAFRRSLTEFAFAEESIGKENIYFFRGCPDITLREQI